MKDYCNICYNVQNLMETVCGHLFCKECIEKWLLENLKMSCPMCRNHLVNVISDHIIHSNQYDSLCNYYIKKYKKYKNLYSKTFYTSDLYIFYIIFFNYKIKDKVYRNHTGKIYKIK
jgi:hypothetical protein